MSLYADEIYSPVTTQTFIANDVTQKIDSFEGEDISIDVIAHAKGVYQICYNEGFDIEVYPNDDNTISVLAIYENYSLEMEVGEGESLPTRYQIGKGLNFQVKWRIKRITQNELSGILSQIRTECQQAALLETLISTKITAAAYNNLLFSGYSKNTKGVFQYVTENVSSTLTSFLFAHT